MCKRRSLDNREEVVHTEEGLLKPIETRRIEREESNKTDKQCKPEVEPEISWRRWRQKGQMKTQPVGYEERQDGKPQIPDRQDSLEYRFFVDLLHGSYQRRSDAPFPNNGYRE